MMEQSEIDAKFKLNPGFTNIFMSDHMEAYESTYVEKYPNAFLAFGDYCFYHQTEDTMKIGEMNEEEMKQFKTRLESEVCDRIANIRYKDLWVHISKGDTRSLSVRSWISNPIIDAISLLLNINNVGKGTTEVFYFDCNCFVSKQLLFI